MILKSFRNFFGLLIVILLISPLKSEEKIDIWNNSNSSDKKIEKSNSQDDATNAGSKKVFESLKKQDTKIQEDTLGSDDAKEVFGVYDPAKYNFNLNMWSTTNSEDVLSSLKRIKKINLSNTSKEILEYTLLSFSYPPEGMSKKKFVQLKINWLIDNDRSDLIESFLKQNEEFDGKKKLVQYLVDQNIAKANIKEGCDKIKFIDKAVKDSYLEKFKIYCLVFDNKNSQAQLLLDLLREQKKSDKFFDEKIDYLLGITDKTPSKINEKNLLNFYLSSITIKDFNYTPTKKTKKEIWKYLNAANLIKLEDVTDKQKIIDLELAANQGQVDEKVIFDIYKQVPFNLSTLINAKNIYQTLDDTDARSLIYQKYLLSEDINSKVEYLFLLEDLFKKTNLEKIFSSKMINDLKILGIDNIPDRYKELAQSRLQADDKTLGKVKYNDKILHQSRIIKFYLEQEDQKKIQKDIDKIFKKISKNKKYFYSAKDLALVDSLFKDGFKIPESFNRKELSSKYEVPKNLYQLIKKEQSAFLALKIVEIIGEDEPYQLDPETIYFITSLLNETDLIEIRNKVLISALPQRV